MGVVFKYDPKNDTTTKIKDIPDKEVLARIEGSWQDKVYYTLGNKPFSKSAVSFPSHYLNYPSHSHRISTSLSMSTRFSRSPNPFPPWKSSSPTNRSSSGTV